MVIKQKHLVEFQIYYLLIVEAFIDLLHFPSIIRYALDANLILLLILSLPKIKNIINDRFFKKYNFYVIVYMGALIIFSLLRQTKIGLVFWAVRNNFFYIFFFFICAYTFKPKDVYRILGNVEKLHIFNVLCVLYEYFILGHYGDNIGGMLGTDYGCNGYLNMYLVIVTAYVIIKYINKKTTILNVLWISLSSMAIAVVSEIKFYFIEFVIIIILSVSLSRLSYKNGFVVLSAVMAVFVGFQLLTAIDTNSADLLKDFDKMTSYASATYENAVISRARPFSQINDTFFNHKLFYNLFGFGFGACESSETFAWANTSFATKYGKTHYRSLSTAVNFLETGYIGLIAFILIFVLFFIVVQKHKHLTPEHRYIMVFSQVSSLLAIINIWYNSSIRRPISYLIFFCMSGAVIMLCDKQRQELKEKEQTLKGKKTYFKQKKKYIR